MAKSGVTRGRLSGFDLMPTEAEGILAWAAQELGERNRTQTDIYAEFVAKCEALMAEHRGELEFSIPAFSSFHRHTVRLARITRRLDETRAIVAAIADKFDAKESDDLTVMTAETIKSLVLHMLSEHDEKVDPKSAMMLAAAFKNAVQAQSISTDRRAKAEAAFKAQVTEAVDKVARAKGMTAETAEAVKAQILGVGA
jgi:hypothetical protein